MFAGAHLPSHFLNQVEGAGNVRINDVPHVIKVLVEEAVPQAVPGVGEQRLDRSALGGGVQPVHAIERGKVGLDSLDRHTERAELLRGIVTSMRSPPSEKCSAAISLGPCATG